MTALIYTVLSTSPWLLLVPTMLFANRTIGWMVDTPILHDDPLNPFAGPQLTQYILSQGLEPTTQVVFLDVAVQTDDFSSSILTRTVTPGTYPNYMPEQLICDTIELMIDSCLAMIVVLSTLHLLAHLSLFLRYKFFNSPQLENPHVGDLISTLTE